MPSALKPIPMQCPACGHAFKREIGDFVITGLEKVEKKTLFGKKEIRQATFTKEIACPSCNRMFEAKVTAEIS